MTDALVPPPAHAHLRWHWITRSRQSDIIEPMLWNGYYWWTCASACQESAASARQLGWRYHGPCNPFAITLNPDDPAQVEAAARMLWAMERTRPMSDWDLLISLPIKSAGFKERQLFCGKTRAVLRALKEMKR